MKASLLIEFICSLLVLLFTYAALSKLADYPGFSLQLSCSLLLSSFTFLAWLLPVAELITALLLVLPAFRPAGLAGSIVLLASFTLYVGGMLLFSSHLPCSCGGVLKQMSWPQHFIFNLFFLLLAMGGLILYRRAGNKVIVI